MAITVTSLGTQTAGNTTKSITVTNASEDAILLVATALMSNTNNEPGNLVYWGDNFGAAVANVNHAGSQSSTDLTSLSASIITNPSPGTANITNMWGAYGPWIVLEVAGVDFADLIDETATGTATGVASKTLAITTTVDGCEIIHISNPFTDTTVGTASAPSGYTLADSITTGSATIGAIGISHINKATAGAISTPAVSWSGLSAGSADFRVINISLTPGTGYPASGSGFTGSEDIFSLPNHSQILGGDL